MVVVLLVVELLMPPCGEVFLYMFRIVLTSLSVLTGRMMGTGSGRGMGTGYGTIRVAGGTSPLAAATDGVGSIPAGGIPGPGGGNGPNGVREGRYPGGSPNLGPPNAV